jgi:polyketide synthase 5
MRHDRGYTGYTPVAGTPWLTTFAQNSRFAEAFRSVDQTNASTGAFLTDLYELPRDEWPARLRRLISDQLSLILRRSVDPDRPLAEYGLDSLGILEVRTKIQTETGIRIGSTDITTVRVLAERLCEILTAGATVARNDDGSGVVELSGKRTR